MKNFVLILLLFSISGLLKAQYSSPGTRNCVFCSVDIGGGYYMPSLDFINDQFYSNSDLSFNGGFIGVAAVEFNLIGGFMVGAQIGTWSDEAQGIFSPASNQRAEERLKINIIPLTFFAKYEAYLVGAPRLLPFLGVGYTSNNIKQEFIRQNNGVLTTENLSGSSSSINLMVGTKFALVKHIDFGLEYNYVIGSFDQQFSNGEVLNTQAVGLDGSMFLAKIGFTIDDRFTEGSKSATRFKGRKLRSRNKFKKGITGGKRKRRPKYRIP